MIQITPQMRIVAAVEPADFRCGIDGLARRCKDVLRHDPFRGWVFVFRNRLSSGRFRWWPRSSTAASKTLAAYQLQVLLSAGNPEATQAAPAWRPVGPSD
jgi:transposase